MSSEEASPGVLGRFRKEAVAFKNGLTMSGGDMGSLSQLFFDNLSTLLGALFAVQNMQNFGVSRSVIDSIIFGNVVPGVGMTLFFGNVYYSWQAIRLTNKYGRQYTAQPYGLNTPAAFAFVYNIWYTVYFTKVDFTAGTMDEAFLTAYKVTLAANFITGAISVFLGCFGRLILKVVPPAALLVPIAGIGIAFLGLEQISYSIAAPIVGYPAMMFVFLGWYSGVKLGYKWLRVPEALQVIIVGVVFGWATGLNKKQTVSDAAKLVKWWGPVWTAGDLFNDFSLIKDYLGIVIPIGISAAATTLMCLVSAKEAGDPYPVRESMIVDGIGTMIASFFGSPFGTVIYIGHPAHKRSGAKVGYSLVNGCIYLIFSWIGLLALLQSIVNQATIGPIVLFVGLMINEEALNFMPARHYAAYIIGLMPSIYDWAINATGTSPLASSSGDYNAVYPSGLSGFIGILAWKRGSLLVSMVWVAMLVMVLDRRWRSATVWAMVGALLAVFGIIHVPKAGFKDFSNPTWEQCDAVDVNGTPTPSCWEHADQWMFFVAYLMLAGFFCIIAFAKRFDTHIGDIIDDPSQHAFDNWFENAAKGGEDTSDSDMKPEKSDDEEIGIEKEEEEELP